eukprot:4606566-Amphidinium_carterae.6
MRSSRVTLTSSMERKWGSFLLLFFNVSATGQRYYRVINKSPGAFKALPLARYLKKSLYEKSIAVAQLQLHPHEEGFELHWCAQTHGLVQLLGGFGLDDVQHLLASGETVDILQHHQLSCYVRHRMTHQTLALLLWT